MADRHQESSCATRACIEVADLQPQGVASVSSFVEVTLEGGSSADLPAADDVDDRRPESRSEPTGSDEGGAVEGRMEREAAELRGGTTSKTSSHMPSLLCCASEPTADSVLKALPDTGPQDVAVEGAVCGNPAEARPRLEDGAPAQDERTLSTVMSEFWREWRARMGGRWTRVPFAVHTLFFTAGGLIGLVAAAFYASAQAAEHLQTLYYQQAHWAVWLTLPLGLPAILAVTRMFFDGCAGSGIPLEMWGMNVVNTPMMARVLSLRIAIGKFALTFASLLLGASIGREGPTVQISSSIFYEMISFTRRFRIKPFAVFFDGTTLAGNYRYEEYLRISILVGGAAGIAGAFNTPLGGIVFAIEEMGHVFSRSLGHIMFCAVTVSAAVSIAVVGFYQWYGTFSSSLTAGQYLMVVPVVGVLGGLMGGLWSLVLLLGMRLKQARELAVLPSPYLLALLCGCGVVLTGWFNDGETYGSGYRASEAIISPTSSPDTLQPSMLFGPLKMVATWLSYWSGIPGGVFAPNIAIGAGLGRLFYNGLLVHIDPSLDEPAVAVLTAVAYFSGVTQSPATSFAILLGMIECRSSIVVAMMACAFLGWCSSRLVCPVPLYAALAEEALKPLPPESCQPKLRKIATAATASGAGPGLSAIELERHLSYI
mmetsp:Transcript_19157/g.53414  ORF Transcript_19157/g.53414 Transcript_19157/m.53414 type:complete len:654 (-) Transcript_19157:996-2957(-)|eukprot:CAMPEP_0117658704 /NCGR_PEP_ID=MMETSP0804-20121206/6005_1 /TAXON_ID=1074897 /ORGANISM="Tetraselmis astigmatica, Strain CCMP880" /LENGTH=653 /DNA_ID=CAMNT_0005465241 /DNA_START=172 /DNA_END=2133 /DNA_ORIENTATION=-